MINENYVLMHDFGYGKEPEQINLNKLELRNVDDLKEYIFDAINNAYICKIKDSQIEILNAGKVNIEIIQM